MGAFEFQKLDLQGAFLVRSFYTEDSRGWFAKSFEKKIYENAGIHFNIDETFASRSAKNVVRGLHFQTCHPQAKFVSVVAGSAWDVMVDLRTDSPTFRQWRAHVLTAENHMGFYIPRGFAHGFASLEDGTVMLYQCDGEYDPESDTGIRFDDPDIGIAWPVDQSAAVYSARDLSLALPG